jgi:hypothetical protein
MKLLLVKIKTSGPGTTFQCLIIRISELLDAGLNELTLHSINLFGLNMSMKFHLLHSHVDCFPKDLSSLSAELGQRFHNIWKWGRDIRDSVMST